MSVAELAKVIPINPEADLENKTLTLYEQALGLAVIDQATYTAAGELAKGIKALEKEIIDYHEPLRVTAKASYDAVLKRKNDDLAPVTEAFDIVKNNMTVWAQEQHRLQQEIERKARIEAEEAAKKERGKLLAQAVKAEERGKDERAESLMEKAEAVYAEPVSMAPVVSKTVRTESGNITQTKETQITVMNVCVFLKELLEKNPGSVASIIKIGDGPLKAFVKANGIEKYAGLHIVKTVGVRL